MFEASGYVDEKEETKPCLGKGQLCHCLGNASRSLARARLTISCDGSSRHHILLTNVPDRDLSSLYQNAYLPIQSLDTLSYHYKYAWFFNLFHSLPIYKVENQPEHCRVMKECLLH